MSGGTILLLVIAGTVAYLIIMYNQFVSLRAGIDAAWSDIDIQLKRRYDLIPALVDTVKGYKAYEGETLEKVIKARQVGLSAANMDEKAVASNMLSGALGKIFALSEAYPDLKADGSFLHLQNELSHLEETIQNARRYYNAIVRDFNAKCESFPDLLIAQKFHFNPREYFQLDTAEAAKIKTMPKINL